MHLDVTVNNEGALLDMMRTQLRKEALRAALDNPERKGKRAVRVTFDIASLILIVSQKQITNIEWV